MKKLVAEEIINLLAECEQCPSELGFSELEQECLDNEQVCKFCWTQALLQKAQEKKDLVVAKSFDLEKFLLALGVNNCPEDMGFEEEPCHPGGCTAHFKELAGNVIKLIAKKEA